MIYRKILLILFLILFWADQANATPVIADLSLRQIEIDSGFTGTEILLFGARNDAGDIVVVIRGPELSYIVRKKERLAGIWLNRKQARFDNINGFYAVASSRPLDDIRNDYLINSLQIGADNIKLLPRKSIEQIDDFRKAFLDRQAKTNLYSLKVEKVSFIGDTLFRTIIKFPDNIPRGVYTAEVYLFSDNQLAGIQSTPIIVSKKGFDAVVFDFAHKYPALYGFISVALALIAGWGAGLIFRKV